MVRANFCFDELAFYPIFPFLSVRKQENEAERKKMRGCSKTSVFGTASLDLMSQTIFVRVIRGVSD
jgi:hypothetical protein